MSAVVKPRGTLRMPPMRPLEELAEFRRGLTYKKTDEVDRSDNAVLRANNVDPATGQMDLSDIRYIDPRISIPDNKRLVPESVLICTAKAGDVLLVQSGHIGHSTVVPKEHEGHNCHAMIVITPIDAIVSGPYLSMLFNTANMRERFEQIRSGSTVPHLTCKMVRELMLDIPTRAVQDQVIAQVAELRRRVDDAIERYESDLASLAALRQSILHKAFAGELT